MSENRDARPRGKRLSLHPLSLDDALKGAMETGPPPKRDKPKPVKRRKPTDKK